MSGKHTAQAVARRLSSGPVVPLTPTNRRPVPNKAKMALVYLVAVVVIGQTTNSATPQWIQWPLFLALGAPIWYAAYYLLPRTLFHTGKQVKIVAADVGEEMHQHGWPTWRDAWGVRGMRPGGWGRALCRGYIRFWMYVVCPISALTLFAGGDNYIAGVIFVIMFAAPLLWAIPCLYVFRCSDFDPAKGLVASGAWVVAGHFLGKKVPDPKPYRSIGG